MELSDIQLEEAIASESKKFSLFYRWLQHHMPASFFQELENNQLLMITHNLMDFDLQGYFSHIRSGEQAFAFCLDSPDADMWILERFQQSRIKNYRSFVSNAPFPKTQTPLRIATISFAALRELPAAALENQEELFHTLTQKNPEVTREEFLRLLSQLNPRFLCAIPSSRLILALDMLFRAKTRDNCQYEIKRHENWEKDQTPSVQIIFAWKGVSKRNFLYRLSKMVYRHHLALKRVNALYIDPDSKDNILLMSLALHGAHGKAAWEESSLEDFLKELVTLKYFEGMESIEKTFVDSGLLSGNFGNLLKSMGYFIHQALVHLDLYAYSFGHVEEGLCRHPMLTRQLIDAFDAKFHPQKADLSTCNALLSTFLQQAEEIDTGNELNDVRRKNILRQGAYFVQFCLKTNFYRNNKSAFCFRFDPEYLKKLPYDIHAKFPELPYAIYFMKGLHFLGFHIRFKDFARGGLRTVIPASREAMLAERNHVFSECYNLGYTQQKKNKDIPEGGAKGLIFLEPFESLQEELELLKEEWLKTGLSLEQAREKIDLFLSIQNKEHLYQAQRAYVDSLLCLINCHEDGTLKAKHIVDYWKQPEYLYLGPDENMHNEMISWIAQQSKKVDYKPSIAFISSKPLLGFNHKELGITSLGVNVYMEEILKHLHIDPQHRPFTVKMTGGPDGDVAGNQMLNLYRFYPHTAKLLTTIDISGTIFDPNGLELSKIAELFHAQKPIADYPPQLLSRGGFLLDTRKKQNSLTLCWKNPSGTVTQEWIPIHEMYHLLRHTVHKTPADIFIPAGGRPRTLHAGNIKDFFLEDKPTARAIVEGANLYLTQEARATLETAGVLIIKDSSANKGGVICSSFEVLTNLVLDEQEFLHEKTQLIREIQEVVAQRAREEASFLLRRQKKTGEPLTQISEACSEQINTMTYKILDVIAPAPLDVGNLKKLLFEYCLPTLKEKYSERILTRIPNIQQKAMIACKVASDEVYKS